MIAVAAGSFTHGHMPSPQSSPSARGYPAARIAKADSRESQSCMLTTLSPAVPNVNTLNTSTVSDHSGWWIVKPSTTAVPRSTASLTLKRRPL